MNAANALEGWLTFRGKVSRSHDRRDMTSSLMKNKRYKFILKRTERTYSRDDSGGEKDGLAEAPVGRSGSDVTDGGNAAVGGGHDLHDKRFQLRVCRQKGNVGVTGWWGRGGGYGTYILFRPLN